MQTETGVTTIAHAFQRSVAPFFLRRRSITLCTITALLICAVIAATLRIGPRHAGSRATK